MVVIGKSPGGITLLIPFIAVDSWYRLPAELQDKVLADLDNDPGRRARTPPAPRAPSG